MSFCISWISKDHPISCIAVGFSCLWGKSPAQLCSFICHLLLQNHDAEFQGWGGVPGRSYPVSLLVKSPTPLLTLLGISLGSLGRRMGFCWSPHQWLGACYPQSTWKGICPVQALLSGNFYNHCKKWKNIECSGGSLGVSWRSSLVDMNISSSSGDSNLPTTLFMSLHTQVRLVGVSDLKDGAGWC